VLLPIQSQGVVVVIDGPTRAVRAVSDNAGAMFGLEAEVDPAQLANHSVDELLAPRAELDDLLGMSVASPDRASPWGYPKVLETAHGKAVICAAQTIPDGFIVEVYPRMVTGEAATENKADRNRFASSLLAQTTVEDYARVLLMTLRDAVGFETGIFYRNPYGAAPTVLAEYADHGRELSGLWLTQGPIEMRRIGRSAVQAVVDIESQPALVMIDDALIFGSRDTVEAVGGVGPVGLVSAWPDSTQQEVMRAGGFRSSLLMEIQTAEGAWGFVALYHRDVKPVPAEILQLCDILAKTTPAAIERIERTDALTLAVNTERYAFGLEQSDDTDGTLLDTLSSEAADLCTMFAADAFVVRIDGVIREYGDVPVPPLEFLNLREDLVHGVATNHRLGERLDMSEDQVAKSAGGAYIELGDDGEDYVFFVRRQNRRSVRWVASLGQPDVPELKDVKQTRLGAFCTADVLGESLPFTDADRDAFRILRRSLYLLRAQESAQLAQRAKAAADRDRAGLRAALIDSLQANMIGEVASTIAHELNQPLAAITNYVGAARKLIDDRGSEIPDDARVAMQGASDEAARAGELVRRLRGFVERGELTFDYEDPVSVIHQARRSASDLFGLDDEQICVVVEGDIPKAMMDRLQIEQVVLNLLRNAFQAMRGDDSTDDQPLATITVSVTDETIEITVSDQGPGIADDMLPTMFRPFHSDHVGGMGIGLTLTASIVRGHSGSVAARNHEDGAEIKIRLPIHQPLTVEI